MGAQSYSNTEHVIIDGASTDGTMRVIHESGISNPNVISEPDDGIFHAMNKGIQRAAGDYLLFLNAGDTLLDSQTVEHAIKSITRSPHGEVYYAGIEWFDPESGVSTPKNAYQATFVNLFRHPPYHQGMFIRRDLFLRIGLYDETYTFAGDYEWILRAFQKHNCRFERIDGYISAFLLGGFSTDGQYDQVIYAECDRARAAHYGRWATLRCRIVIRTRKILGI